MIDVKYSLVVQATDDSSRSTHRNSRDSVAWVTLSRTACIRRARWGMREHVELLLQCGLPVPSENDNPTVIVHNRQ
jgi:hypothetical protein